MFLKCAVYGWTVNKQTQTMSTTVKCTYGSPPAFWESCIIF